MKLRIIDFQELTSHYLNYAKGISIIEENKKAFLKRVEPLRDEINLIISSTVSSIETEEEQKAERFQYLQQEISNLDNDFKYDIRQTTTKLNEETYDELSTIIKEWSDLNEIDVVIGKMEVVCNKPEYEATNEIIEIIKEKQLYI